MECLQRYVGKQAAHRIWTRPQPKRKCLSLCTPFIPQVRYTTHSSSTPGRFCPYQTLDVPKTATLAQIKKAYYKRVFDLHPDRQVASHLGSSSHNRKKEPRRADPVEKEQFLRVVKAYEILSDKKRRNEWDSTGSFTSEHVTGTSSRPRSGFGPGTDFDPYGGYRWQSPRGWQSTDDDYFTYYYANVASNTGPRYMSNGRMASIIVLVAVLSGVIVFLHVKRMRRYLREHMDAKDAALQQFYDARVQKARENGFDKQIEGLKGRAAAIELAEEKEGRTTLPVGRDARRTGIWERDEVPDYSAGDRTLNINSECISET
ncbi:uncharacterized protein SPPG_03784 [Spizellomyces punctatus DAOM BR117]|uniref:J domain-containing protein n=1 Tax=Spizellomyces punctatus (strain DAOM BR117) TaxID=645134 RepID=A0A0L0HGS7_SPIPD|nr:uncharacterized protein SPPG_03784 [Spizellomyces punctatus DAOM BR117]KND00661.1 hypothetical protein SPPG_03784 [Spizellomyces punctatus DAOM BR117]|eukprot:XP_016608700.1 hypothetical protein SPPG_03784 [Spizellomyces punctatus DAOM BR117]